VWEGWHREVSPIPIFDPKQPFVVGSMTARTPV